MKTNNKKPNKNHKKLKKNKSKKILAPALALIMTAVASFTGYAAYTTRTNNIELKRQNKELVELINNNSGLDEYQIAAVNKVTADINAYVDKVWYEYNVIIEDKILTDSEKVERIKNTISSNYADVFINDYYAEFLEKLKDYNEDDFDFDNSVVLNSFGLVVHRVGYIFSTNYLFSLIDDFVVLRNFMNQKIYVLKVLTYTGIDVIS